MVGYRAAPIMAEEAYASHRNPETERLDSHACVGYDARAEDVVGAEDVCLPFRPKNC